MEERTLKPCRESDIGWELREYIRMCVKAKTEIDEISTLRGNFYYYKQGEGIMSESNLEARADSSSEFERLKYSSEYILLPDLHFYDSSPHLGKSSEQALNNFLTYDNGVYGYPLGMKPSEFFIFGESARLAYVMNRSYKKVWDWRTGNWVVHPGL